jgi:calcium-dependent protein kinase
MHEAGLIHRDLKPENIMFQHEKDYQSLRIIDFGLATYANLK